MYKKLVTFLVFSLYAPLAAFSADDPSRARLYIPVSTGVSFTGCTTCEGKASGYAGHYVFGFGLGLGVSSNKLSVSGDPLGDYSINTGPMLDVSYSFGSDFTFTLGLGVGSSPSYDRSIVDTAGLTDWKFAAESSSKRTSPPPGGSQSLSNCPWAPVAYVLPAPTAPETPTPQSPQTPATTATATE